MKLETGKRKRISFAKDVESTENTSEAIQAQKRKKMKEKEENNVDIVPAVGDETTEDTQSDVWSAILAQSKSSGLNYEDAMKNFLLEKLRAVVEQPSDPTVLAGYAEFMKEMSTMFGKLHRYPKMISKFLFCIRTEILDALEKADDSGSKRVDWVKVILPAEFLELIPPSVSLLPISQVIDLWKTLHHNLDEESIKPLLDGTAKSSLNFFVPIVVELLAEFMSSIKVSDSSVPVSQMEKIGELMSKTEFDCLSKLGSGLVNRINNSRLLSSFLKLAFIWSELEWMFHAYNPKYKVQEGSSVDVSNNVDPEKILALLQESTSAFNLAFVHPYLTVSEWASLAESAVQAGEAVTSLLINLVMQKVKRLRLLQWKIESSGEKLEEMKSVIKENLVSAASFLWLLQLDLAEQAISSAEVRELLPLAMSVLQASEVLSIADNVVKKLDSRMPVAILEAVKSEQNNKSKNSQEVLQAALGADVLLFSSVLLQLTNVVARRLGKMKLEKKFFKLLRAQVFTPEGQMELLQVLTHGKSDSANPLENFLNVVNEFLSEHENLKVSSNDKTEFSPEMIQHLLEFLVELPTEELSKEIKAFLCLFSIPTFIGVVSFSTSSEDAILALATDLVNRSGSNTRGSPILFNVKWCSFIRWLMLNVELLSLSPLKKVLFVVLQNIYMSSKNIEEFEPILKNMCEEFRLDGECGDVAILTAQLLAQELKDAIATKSKLVQVMRDHLRLLLNVFEKELKKAPQFDSSFIQATEDGEMKEAQTLTRTFRACCLLQAVPKLLQNKDSPNGTVEPPSLNDVIPQHIESALTFLRKYQKKKSLKKLLKQSPDLGYARDSALEFLLGICEAGKDLQESLPSDFISRLWNYCYKADNSSGLVTFLVQHIYHLGSFEDFQSISEAMIDDLRSISVAEVPEGKQLARVTLLVEKLIDADLSPEKKQIRWNIMEEFMLGFLKSSLHWKNYEEAHYFPVLDLHLKMLRRRNAMCKLDTLAYSFIAIIATPLKTLESVSKFRTAFCKAADLLNAFIVHRLDVVSFRTHLVIQCFEYLVGCLTMRADQKNNLNDVEIFDLRYCAHSIERICQSTKLHQKEFARISPYFLAIMLRQVDVCLVYPAIKTPLMNGCYKLLDMCDDHGVAQLNSMLSAGSREIFKATYDLYKKYYRYTGKV